MYLSDGDDFQLGSCCNYVSQKGVAHALVTGAVGRATVQWSGCVCGAVRSLPSCEKAALCDGGAMNSLPHPFLLHSCLRTDSRHTAYCQLSSSKQLLLASALSNHHGSHQGGNYILVFANCNDCATASKGPNGANSCLENERPPPGG